MYRSTLAALVLAALSTSATTALAGGCSGGGGRVVHPRPIYRPIVHERIVEKPVVSQPKAQPQPKPAPPLPSVVSGSRVVLDGLQFGGSEGRVVMKVGPLTMPVTVIEWNAVAVEVQMPNMDLDLALPAKLTVLRANGSLVTVKEIKLTPETPRLALGY